MKKILNEPVAYVDEMLEGLCAAHPEYFRRSGPQGRLISRATGAVPGKVGIVSGGGSGHLPVFTGFVGRGLLDACAIGEVFSSPSVDQMAEAIRVANGGAGVLRLYGHYGGDNMNFDIAGEIVEMEGIETTTVRVADDVASASRRALKTAWCGRFALCIQDGGCQSRVYGRVAGGYSVAQKAADSCRSVGVALTPCTVPAVGKPTFELSDEEMEIGMGIHGEPGVRRRPLRAADLVAQEMLSLLLSDMPLRSGERISVLVNSLGATPLDELCIVYRYVARKLAGLNVKL